MKCPACKKGTLEPVMFSANCSGNNHAAWCPRCETSVLWWLPWDAPWYQRSLEYLCS